MFFKVFIVLMSFVFASVVHAAAAPVQAEQIKDKNKKKKTEKNEKITVYLADEKKDDFWFDVHETISNSVYDTAHWFDSFFASDSNTDLTPETSARIRLGIEPRARNLNELDSKFRLKVKLPNLKNKADLIFTDDSEDELSRLPLEAVHAKPELHDDSFSASVRLVHKNDAKRFWDTRVGMSGGDVFVKGRFKRQFNVSEQSIFRVEPSLFYYFKDGFGQRLLMQYEYRPDSSTEYRATYTVRGSESFSGIRWKHGVYRLKQLDNTTASMMGLIVNGERNGDEGFFIDNYSLNYRYRFNAYKSWMFFEVEPFVEWPRDYDYKVTPGIALRIEGFFNKS